MRLRSLFRRSAADREMREEMRLHLARATERLIERGLSPEDARLAARREFGNVATLQEEGRDVRGGRWIESFLGDLRFALRYFRRKPLMTATVVLVLSIGIGGHAAVFSLIEAATLRPPPGVPDDPTLVVVRGKERFSVEATGWVPRAFSYPEFRELAAQRDVFASVAGWSRLHVSVNGADDDSNTSAQVQFVTAGFFSTVGVRPLLGPGLSANDRPAAGDAALVAVIGHTFWRDAFASSPAVVGKTVRVNDVAVRIVGVAPPRFNGVVPASGARTLWMPMSARTAITRTSSLAFASRDSAMVEVVARLRKSVPVARADAAVRVIDARDATFERLADSTMQSADVVPLRGEVRLGAANDLAQMIALLEATALLMLLITCTNVSALIVGSGIARRHEIAVRLSLGASRARLIRQMLTESSLLAVAGGVMGLLAYWWVARVLASQMPRQDIVPDISTAIFTACFAVITGILFGLSPALHATRDGAAAALKELSAGVGARSRLQRLLIAVQIALTQPLLVGVGVTIAFLLNDGSRRSNAESLQRIIAVDFTVFGGILSFDDQMARVAAAMQHVVALPGVVGAIRSPIGYSPLELTVHSSDRGLPRSMERVDVRLQAATPGFFDLMELPIVRGRALVGADTLSVKVNTTASRSGGMIQLHPTATSGIPTVIPVVIGSRLAHELWGNADPIGRRFERKVKSRNAQTTYVIVGVYDSGHELTPASRPYVYGPMNQSRMSAYLIRTVGPAAPLLASVRTTIHTAIPRIPIARLETLADREEAERADALTTSGAAGGVGVLALLLASVGLYGVVALALGQRRREIGIRIAIGARPRQVVRMFLAAGLRVSALGLVLGLPLSVVAMKLIANEISLPGVNIPLVGAAIALIVLAVATFATWLPARHAANIDPMVALRVD